MKAGHRSLFILLTVMSLLAVSPGALAADNVALGKPVSLNPLQFGVPGPAYAYWAWEMPAPPVAAFSTVTDGVFLTEGHQWNMDTVWWDETYTFATMDVYLLGDYHINRLVVQADNNDDYIVNLDNDLVCNKAIIIPAVPGWGMMTREILLSEPVLTDMIRFGYYAPDNPGDYLAAVSEFQAYGVPIPAPAAILLVGSGLFSLIPLRRRL